MADRELRYRITGDARELSGAFASARSSAAQFGSEAQRELTAVQARIEKLSGVRLAIGGGAEASAAVFEELSAGAARLRAALDPIGERQRQVNAEIAQAADLWRRGAISIDEYVAAQARAYKGFSKSDAFIGPPRNPYAEDIASANAEMAAGRWQNQYAKLMGIGPASKSASDSAGVFEAAHREAEALDERVRILRAQLDPLAAAQAKVNAELAEFRSLAAAGRLTAAELTTAEAQAAEKLKAIRASMDQKVTGFAGLKGWEMKNLGFQANDIVTMAMMGASPMQIASSQGGQVFQLLAASEKGAVGTLKAMAAAAYGLVGPFGLAAGAMAGVAAASFALIDKGRDVSRALEENIKLVDDFARARDRLDKGDRSSNSSSAGVLSAQLLANKKDLEELSKQLSDEIVGNAKTISPFGVLQQIVGMDADWSKAASRFAPFQSALERFQSSVGAGNPKVVQFREEVQRLMNAAGGDDKLLHAGNELLKMSDSAAQAEVKIEKLKTGIVDAKLEAERFASAMRTIRSSIPDWMSSDRPASFERYADRMKKLAEAYATALSSQQGSPFAASDLFGKFSKASDAAKAEYDAANPNDFLKKYLKPGMPAYAITSASDDVKRRLAEAFSLMESRGITPPTINEGYRTAEDQIALRRSLGSKAARPGTSLHERGLAFDLSHVTEEQAAILEQAGFVRGGAGEGHHFSMAQVAIDERNSKSLEVYGQDESWRKSMLSFDKTTAEINAQRMTIGMQPETLARYKAVLEATAEAERIYGTVTKDMRQEIERSAETRAAAVMGLDRERRAYEGMQEAEQFAGSSLTDAFSSLATRSATVEQAINRIIQSLIQAGFQAALLGQGPLAGLFGTQSAVSGQMGGVFGWLFSGAGARSAAAAIPVPTLGGVYHDGGLVGDGGPYRLLPPMMRSAYESLPRYHSGYGLASDERLAVFQTGEIVVPRDEVAGLRDTVPVPDSSFGGPGGAISNLMVGGYAPTIHMNMPTSSGDPARDRAYGDQMRRDLERTLDAHAEKWFTRASAPGGIAARREFEA
jgi:hypothetical protein